MKPQHDCPICQRTRLFRQALERVPEQDKEFWDGIFDALFHADSDRDYWRSIVDGSWPNADDVIAKYRPK